MIEIISLHSVYRKSIVLLLMLYCIDGASLTLDSVKQQISEYLHRQMQTDILPDHSRIEFEFLNLDRRRQLKPCDQPLAFNIRQRKLLGRVNIKIICESNNRWSTYMPVFVHLYTPILVAANTIPKDTIIDRSNLIEIEVDLAKFQQEYIQSPELIIGKSARRTIKMQTAFRSSLLIEPKIVNKGDAVIIIAKHKKFNIKAPGKALENGKMGEQIRVKNTKSNRIIDAWIIGPGQVKVLL